MSEFKYVPVEPTDEMRIAWNTADGNSESYFSESAYKAMLAAAPEQPSPSESDKEAVRNAALEECIRECERIAFDVTDTGIQTGAEICADSIESLKSRPSINVCNQCSGSGEFRKPLSVDPDEYVELGDCPDCRGTGVRPAQPSDTEILDWMLKNNGLVEIRGSQYYCGYGPYGTVLNGALAGSPREAIKAAMRAEREGK